MMKVPGRETAALIIPFLPYFITYGPSVVKLIIPGAVTLQRHLCLAPIPTDID
jgi:hypothetical protein